MARILIESRPADTIGIPGPFDHLYLVFVGDNGDETVIRGGPERDVVDDWGALVLEIDMAIEDSKDARIAEGTSLSPADRGSRELDLSARDAHDVWSALIAHAEAIHAATLPYDSLPPGFQNSNSVIASLLNAIGISVDGVLPFNTTSAMVPGIGNALTFGSEVSPRISWVMRRNTGA